MRVTRSDARDAEGLGFSKIWFYLGGMIPDLLHRRIRLWIAFTLVFVITPGALRAQTINFQSGVSISNLHSVLYGTDYTFLGHTRVDPSFFIGMEYLERKYWCISTNVGYVRKGGNAPSGDTDSLGRPIPETTLSETFDYVSVNTLLNLKYPLKGNWIPYVSFGPHADFMTSHTHTFPYFDYPALDLHKRSYGVVYAVGIRYAFSHFLVGLRAEHLVDVTPLVDLHPNETNYTHTSILSATIGYRFRSKRVRK
jgi:hypothetical protein